MPNYNNPNRSQFFNGPLDDRMTEDLHLTGKASSKTRREPVALEDCAAHPSVSFKVKK